MDEKKLGGSTYRWEKVRLAMNSKDIMAINRIVMYFDSMSDHNITSSSVDAALNDIVGSEIYDGGALSGISDRSGIDKDEIIEFVKYLVVGDDEIETYDAEAEDRAELKESAVESVKLGDIEKLLTESDRARFKVGDEFEWNGRTITIKSITRRDDGVRIAKFDSGMETDYDSLGWFKKVSR